MLPETTHYVVEDFDQLESLTVITSYPIVPLMSNVYPGVQLDTRVDSFCRSVTEWTWLHLTVLAYRTSLSGSGRDK